MPTAASPEPPYRQIAAEIRSGIAAGDLRPGDRVPSVRQIARRWGVAVATANRVMAVLRDEGLVETRVGAGTVVSSGDEAREAPVAVRAPRRAARSARPGLLPPPLTAARIRRTAVAVADREGLESVTMRRIAAELGVGPMSLYRHVATKEALVAQMVEEVVGPNDLPDPGPEGWRAKLELMARLQWRLARRHLWLARAVSFTRPLLVPSLAAHTEWALRALDGLGLSPRTRFHEALTLHAIVTTAALSMADEIEAEQESGVTLDRWRQARREQTAALLDGGRFPLLAAVPEDAVADLDGRFEYALARHLDGVAVMLGEAPR
ncbi:TetR/AcrR family transcriptional regulator C-terminal domain-containing protein [Glycomyces sp. A-F 0318]|uniref:TetR/AcrR family transcriptional regulator C-terminal domain-containing protein n=1 Tax=Glycomyces amatae TaxID=2881355 RepID=UPI001E2C23D2|nr:TetR/AcrR family transcriptional regulator C-terminal domain-containing protein [Glycomyces amatae]MCD0445444.1 TetR/AcrR family transcriptional regulator C-terminal domain-containing protein [Glycomyces amatae]